MRQIFCLMCFLLLVALLIVGCGLEAAPTVETVVPLAPSPAAEILAVRAFPSPTPQVGGPTETTPVIEPEETESPASTLSAAPAARPQYRLDVLYFHQEDRAQVREVLTYTNLSRSPLQDLLLRVEAARSPGAFYLLGLTWENGDPVQDYSWEGSDLRLKLLQPLPPGEPLTLSLDYNITLPSLNLPTDSLRPVVFGYTNRQSNFVEWYPFIPPYQEGVGWVAHKPNGIGEHLVYDLADFEVSIQLGEAASHVRIAASALSETAGNPWRYRLEEARNFVWSASTEYISQAVQMGDVIVTSYYFASGAVGGQAALEVTARAVALYSEWFGEPPHKAITIVQADFYDGMEYSGLYFLSGGYYATYDDSIYNYLTTIAAHETAHQWWYEKVGNDQALEPWLDEAMCTFSERLYYEHLGETKGAWWWEFRVTPYPSEHPVNLGIADFNSFRDYRDAVYLRGARFLSDLRLVMGEEDFRKFMLAYAGEMAGKIATREDFFALAAQSGADLSELMRLYFRD